MLATIRKGSIFKELLFKILPWVVGSLILVSYLIFLNARENLQSEILSNLDTIADRHFHQIDHYILERQRNLSWLSQSMLVKEALPQLQITLPGRNDPSIESSPWSRRLRKFLTAYQENYGYQDIYLVSMNGRILFSVQQREDLGTNLLSGKFRNTELAQVFFRAITMQETEISQFNYYPPQKGPAGFIAAPVFDGIRFIGAVAMQINNRRLYQIINDYTGLGRTGESVVVTRRNNNALVVAPTRFDPLAAFNRTIPENISGVPPPAQKALMKWEGKGPALDYRGKEVLAVWRYLPSVRWGIVVKMDTEEALAPVTRVQNAALFLGLCFVLLVITAILKSARDITNPIQEMKSVACKVAEGDLDRRVTFEEENEFKDLGDAFNTMTQRLQDSYRNLEKSHEEVKKQSLKLQNANKELKQSNEELDHFAMVAAHDLQEPLRKISFFTQSLKHVDMKSAKEVEVLIQKINKASNRMQYFIKDLLEFSHATYYDRPKMTTHLHSLVHSVVEDMEVRLGRTGTQVEVGPLPRIYADVFHLKRVFQNLISNAIKFRKKGEPSVIRIYSRLVENGDVEVVVEDNGIGIPSQHAELVFNPFERLNSKSQYEGTGLGLSFCRKILKEMKGDIRVESQPGVGSAFILRFPESAVSESESLPPSEGRRFTA